MDKNDKLGILLSGGIDSSVLALLANELKPTPCFTIGVNEGQADIISARRLAAQYGWDLRVYLAPQSRIEELQKNMKFNYQGDDAVYLAIEFASQFVAGLLATDGIDELMGGYWWHTHKSDRFQSIEQAFEYFWGELEPKHLSPMFSSAKTLGMDLYWIYLYPEVTEYIKRIPLIKRVGLGKSKIIMRQLAKRIGLPKWVIDRPKRGFCDALN